MFLTDWALFRSEDRGIEFVKARCKGALLVVTDDERGKWHRTPCTNSPVFVEISNKQAVRRLKEVGWRNGLCPNCAQAMKEACPGPHPSIPCGVKAEIIVVELDGRHCGYCQLHGVQHMPKKASNSIVSQNSWK